MLAVVAPVLHTKVVPAKLLLTVMLAEAPLQISVALEVRLNTGLGYTVTVVVADPVQPLAVPVTEYVVEDAGLTTIEAVVAPLLQRYVVPGKSEEAVKVVLSPSQIAGLTGVIETSGLGLTTTVTESISEQRGANEMSSRAKSLPE